MNRSIIVLGGGTAGWMSASLLYNALHSAGFEITLIESSQIPTVGVGEGSTPHLKRFFDTLNIAESTWMPRCHATYKNGIRFSGWANDARHPSYFHPFPSLPDRQTAGGFLINSLLRRQGHAVNAHPDPFFLSAYLAQQHMSPITQPDYPMSINYGYHFDAGKLGLFLAEHAQQMGVKHVVADITQVDTHPSGDIAALLSAQGQRFSADWFIDCSGFSGKLIQQTLQVPFESYSNNLFNDAAVAVATPMQTNPASQTTATALSHGWCWRIPLTHRTGNGYVYSSDYVDADKAERQLRQHLNLGDEATVRHLQMRVGRVAQHWYKNCLAVGLSQGFIEPLEATALHLVQDTLENFCSAFAAGDYSIRHQAEFNQHINQRFEGIRDYIVAHYHVNQRNDSDYWRDNRNNTDISDTLKAILACWDNGGDLTRELQQLGVDQYYSSVSWHCLLAGYQRFAELGARQPASHEVDIQQIQQFIQRWSQGFIPHQQALAS